MKHVSELQKTLSQYLDWNKARVNCLVQILQALFYVRTVNLAQIAEAFQATTKEESAYRRIQRFFKEFSFDMSFIVVLVLNLFVMDRKVTLIMDRTNWKWGKKPINILMLSVEYYGIGIPLFWEVLNTGGTSSTKERKSLLQRVIKRFGVDRIEVLLADREFIGEAWFRFLIVKKIPFVIRIKQNFMAEGIRIGYEVPVKTLLAKLNGRRKKLLNYPIVLWGHALFVSIAHAKGAKEPMIVVSNRHFPNALKIYCKRWGIETLFGCLKGRGFRMEDTHMTEENKIEKLVFILAIAFCWAYKTGEIQARQAPIMIKKHGRKAKSIFRLGLNFIRSILLRAHQQIERLTPLLSCFTLSISGGRSI
jgi:hypothetical protein